MNQTQTEQELLSSLEQPAGNMFEQAAAMHTLCSQYRYTQASLAKRLGVSQSCVGNKIRLLQFSSAERMQIVEYGLTERHARIILRIQSPKRSKLITTVGNMHLTVQKTEELVEKYSDMEKDVAIPHQYSIPVNADSYIAQTQAGAERLRNVGYKTTCLTESGEGWCRITVTIVE